MSDNDNVVFLEFSNDKTSAEVTTTLACKHCRNKTFMAIYQHDSWQDKGFPSLICAFCKTDIGKFGWANDE